MQLMKSETEQRYLIKPEELDTLKKQAGTPSRIIQGYLPALPQLENRITLDTDSATLSISERLPDGSVKPHLSIAIPKDEGELLQSSGLLDRIRLRYEHFPYETPGFGYETKRPKAYLTIKGDRIGATAPEYEYVLPEDQKAGALHLMINFCRDKLIAKERSLLGEFELDVFDREDIPPIAEREVKKGMRPLIELPSWASEDITEDKRYGNYAIAGPDPKSMTFLKTMHAALAQQHEHGIA